VRTLILAAVVLACAACGDASSDVGKGPGPAAARPGASAEIVIPPDSPQLSQIRVAVVEAGDVSEEDVVAPARIGIDPNRSSKVLMPVPGRIDEVLVRLGDHVERGRAVATIESPDADAAVAAYRQSQATVRQAEAAVGKTENDYERVRDLREHGAAAQKDVEAARNDRAQAHGALEAARAGREQARRKLELLGLQPTESAQRVLVRAPIDGKVLDVGVAPGEYRNDTNTPLMTIADLSRVWVSAEVAESSIAAVRAGDAVTITLVAFPGQDFAGRVTRIADVVDPQTRTVKVYVELANPGGRLRPDMFGTMRHAGPRRRVALLPPAAVVQQYGRTVVFRERTPGRFERQEVRIGWRRGDAVAVVDGIAAGERVVVDGAVLLKDR